MSELPKSYLATLRYIYQAGTTRVGWVPKELRTGIKPLIERGLIAAERGYYGIILYSFTDEGWRELERTRDRDT